MNANERKSKTPTAAPALGGMLLAAVLLSAQAPAGGPILSLAATTTNVSGANEAIRIDLLRWSTDAERDELLGAWNMTLPAAPAAGARGGRGGAGGGGGRGGAGRGAAAAAPAAGNQAAGDNGDAAAAAPPAAAAAGGRGGRGGGGGRGGRGGAPAADAPKPTPEGTLAAELAKTPTVGYLWSSEVAGYAVHYAGKFATPDGGQRIVLITDRRLGAWNDVWKPTAGGDLNTSYEFSVIELHLNAKNEGEGKTSLTGKVALDSAVKAVALENYAAAPVVFKGVKPRTN